MTPHCSSTMDPHCMSHMTPDRTLPIGISHLLVPFQRFQSRLQVRVYIVWLQAYILYLLKWTLWLLLFLCLERRTVFLRAATICRVCVCYCPCVRYCPQEHDKLRQVDEAFCFTSIVHGQHVYKTVWTSVLFFMYQALNILFSTAVISMQ